MESSKLYPLEKEVHVDEFEIGTPQSGEQGRSKSDKKVRVVVAFEDRDGKAGRGYARVIDDYSTASLKPIFDDHISGDAAIKADGWKAMLQSNRTTKASRRCCRTKGRTFPCCIYRYGTSRTGFRGVHSYCNREYLQRYIDEYFFCFNRRNHRETILDRIIERCVNHPPTTYGQLKVIAN